jgi:hypothetical protein
MPEDGLDFPRTLPKVGVDLMSSADAMRKLIPLAVWGILLAGCASSSSVMLTDDTALISVLGQGSSDRARLINQALAIAARATRTRGYRYFVIVDTADASRRGVKVAQAQIFPANTLFRGNILSNLDPTFLPGSDYTRPNRRIPYVRPGIDVTIRMYRDGEVSPDTEGVWNPDTILGAYASPQQRAME